MERVQPPQSSGQSFELDSLSPFPEAEPGPDLEQLVLAARLPGSQEGREALNSLHVSLETLRPTERNARELLRLLDDGAFHELRGDDGSSTRELAVETLLRLGYPWALQIHPDELAWYRQALFERRRNKWLLLLGVLAVGGIAQAFLLQLF